MADYEKLLQVPRGTKARLETIKLNLLVNTIVYATDTKELGIKLSDGNIEYFKNATDIDAIVDTLEISKQDKLVAGDNITIDENTNVISGDGIDLNEMAYFDYAGSIYGDKYSLLANAWEHSLTVVPSEIERESTLETQYGTLQYPNGEDNGVIIPEGVTSIGNYAFRGWNSNNQPLVIPDSVTSIGSSVFRGWNSNNQPLVIPDSVTSIANSAFYGWSANNHPLVIPDSVTSIANIAFYGWSSNNHPLVIPNSVTSIGKGAFMNWSSNNQPLVIPNSVTSIDNQAFLNWWLVPYVEILAITPPTLTDTGAFGNQNNAPIYVPDESVEAYKTATNWVDLADRIFPVSDKADLMDDIADLQENKQDKLVAGENITIEDNVISATGGGLAVETWNTATKTLALSDSNKLFKCSHTANQTLTIPTNATVAFPIGTMITFLLTSTNKVTFSGASGVTLTSIDSLVELATQYAMASLIKTDTNTWQLVGALE